MEPGHGLLGEQDDVSYFKNRILEPFKNEVSSAVSEQYWGST